MTVPANRPVTALYQGTGLVNVYPIPFQASVQTDIKATVESSDAVITDLVYGQDYALSNLGRDSILPSFTLVDNGQDWITVDGNLSSQYKLLIRFTDVAYQPLRIRDTLAYTPAIIETAFDRLTMFLKSLRYDVGKAISIATENPNVSTQFPPLEGSGGAFIKVTDDELGFTYQHIDALPGGGDTGAVPVRDVNGDAVWDDMKFEGFSARFNTAWNSSGLRDTLEKILNLTYLAPTVSLTVSGSGTIREKGTPVSSVVMTAAVTRRTDLIAAIRFYVGGVMVNEMAPPANQGSGSTPWTYVPTFTDNTSFQVRVEDDGSSGGPTIVSSNFVNFTFVYPYYHGCGAPSLSSSQVGMLTKTNIVSTADLTRSFTSVDGDVYYFAYPASYGPLTDIRSSLDFPVLNDWEVRTENITGLDGSPQSYLIYEFKNPVTAGSTTFRFIR